MVTKRGGCVLYAMENGVSLNGSGKGRPVFVICAFFFLLFLPSAGPDLLQAFVNVN